MEGGSRMDSWNFNKNRHLESRRRTDVERVSLEENRVGSR